MGFFSAFDDEFEAVILFFQIGQFDLCRLCERVLHVIDQKGLKVAGDDVAGVQIDGQIGDVALGLLKRREEAAVALLDPLAEVFVAPFLLDHDAGSGDVGVDKAHVLDEHGVLKLDELFRFFHAEHAAQQ